MANVLIVMELIDGRVLPVRLEALGQARRISTQLGATVYAVVPLARAPSYGEDDVIAVLGDHGADKVVLVTDESLAATSDSMRWGTHGPALGAVSELLPPSLMLFGATPGGREVAARVAARIGAAYMAEAWLEVRNGQLTLWEGSGEQARALDGELEFPVVATIPPGRYQVDAGVDEAEVEILTATGQGRDFEELSAEADPRTGALVLCSADGAREAAAQLSVALGGAVSSGDARVAARLAVTLGPDLAQVSAEARVSLGVPGCGADYSVEGNPAELARDLAAAVGGSGGRSARSTGGAR